MAASDKGQVRPHRLELQDRAHLTATGVTEVVRFDEEAVVLRTVQGILDIRGSNLQLKNLSLDGGQVAVDGTIESLAYTQAREGGWLRRMFG